LHGTGNIPVVRILDKIGARGVTVVAEQELPDPNFDTCPYPNPEEKAALALALEYGKAHFADLVVATDPDADRVGIAVKDGAGEFRLLNGNETGVLLMDYMLSRKTANGTLGAAPTVIKTIVSSDMAFSVAEKYGASVKEVLTGFKYIGEQMDLTDNFVMGMEESYGYLVGTHARDKDGVSAVMLIVEMCAYYKSLGISLYDKLCKLYSEHGYYLTDLVSMTYPGASGAERMRGIIASVRENPSLESALGPFEFTDFGNGVNGLPKSDVLRFQNDTVRVLIRPSGTEPKMKIYYQVKAADVAAAEGILDTIKKDIKAFLN
jgi:phosphoglucomutase